MLSTITKYKQQLALFSILIISLTLRLIGITWGLPTDSLPIEPLHPDEKWAMEVFSQMNWSLGDFNPEMGHREGTFAYYIWGAFAYFLKQAGIINSMYWELLQYDSSYGNFILSCRLLTVLLDVSSVFLVYYVIKNIIHSQLVAITGALLLAITPFEVIHAHYARTHIIANFFLMCVIASSLKLYQSERLRDVIIPGIFSGMCFATRYPVGVSVIIPISILIFNFFNNNNRSTANPIQIKQTLLRICTLLLFTLIGFFICDPYLFLDFESARPHLIDQAAFIDQREFSWESLFNFGKIWVYLTYLIPYGTYPFLWILYYFGSIYLIFQPKLYRFSIPLILYSTIYFYSMAKGYTTELIFIRPTLAIMPTFAILSALAIKELGSLINFRWFTLTLKCALGLIITSSFIFTYSYVNAMSGVDPRTKLYQYFASQKNRATIEVCALPYVRNFIVMSPALNAITNPKINFVTREDIAENPDSCDYFIIAAYEPGQRKQAKILLRATAIDGTFSLVETFSNPIKFSSFVFSNRNYPHDLQYPFPLLHLLKRKN